MDSSSTTFCHICSSSFRPSDKTIQTGSIIHHDRQECTPGKCYICTNEILNDHYRAYLSDTSKLGTRLEPKLVHKACSYTLNCSKCSLRGGTLQLFGTDSDRFAHHVGFCRPDLCSICSLGIGSAQHVIIGEVGGEDLFIHSDCIALVACYICKSQHSGTRKMRSWIKDVDGYRHVNCNPSPCAECQRPLGSDTRKVFGKEYHHMLGLFCGPVCAACHLPTNRDNDFLEMLGDGRLKHRHCSLDLCIVCRKVLGREWTTLDTETGIIMPGLFLPYGNLNSHIVGNAHQDCLIKCDNCMFMSMNVVRIPFDPVLHPLNLPYLHPEVTLSAAACRRALRLRKVSKDMRRLILSYIAETQVHDRTLPFRNQGHTDIRRHCSEYRCEELTCEWCEGPLFGQGPSWTRYYMCNFEGCSVIKTKIRNLLAKVFNAKFVLAGWGCDTYNSQWPLSHATGLREIEKLMLNGMLDGSLTTENIRLCGETTRKIGLVINGQLPVTDL
jgi:hypothetical protein